MPLNVLSAFSKIMSLQSSCFSLFSNASIAVSRGIGFWDLWTADGPSVLLGEGGET